MNRHSRYNNLVIFNVPDFDEKINDDIVIIDTLSKIGASIIISEIVHKIRSKCRLTKIVCDQKSDIKSKNCILDLHIIK